MSVCEVRFLFDSYGGNTLHESKICSTKMNTRNGYSTLEGFPSFKKKKKIMISGGDLGLEDLRHGLKHLRFAWLLQQLGNREGL
jgi:hypothetical protein